MTDTTTTNYGWIMPGDHVNTNTWGALLNGDLQGIDSQVYANEQAIAQLNNGVFVNNQLVLNKTTVAAGNPFYGQLNGVPRWLMEMGDPTAEGALGSNVGSNFTLYRYDDLGNIIDATLNINRATGAATFGGAVSAPSLAVTGAISCNSISSATVVSVPGISSPTVNATTVNATTVNATTVNATGPVIGNTLTASNGFVNIVRGSAANATLFLNDNAVNTSAFFYDQASLQTIVGDLISGAQLTLDSVGNFHFVGTANAYKAGGGSWSAPSDARIKTVTGEYTSGLNEVLQLNPITYVYRGNETRTARTAGQSFVGLVADEVLPVMPEMVKSKRCRH